MSSHIPKPGWHEKTNLYLPGSKLLAQRTALIPLRFRLFAQPWGCPIPQH